MWWSILTIVGFACLGLWAYWDEFDFWYEYVLKPKVDEKEKEEK